MKNVEFVHAKDVEFRTVRDFVPQQFLNVLSKDDHQTEIKDILPGDETHLALMEIKEIPNAVGGLHSHAGDEIFYVLEGELRFGNRVCAAGDSISILAGTVYRIAAGPGGCRYLKFTGAADRTFIPAE